jgi:glutamine amidotransferase
MRVSLFDYGTGNLHSLQKALEGYGVEVRIDADPTAVLDADAMVLPGVGAFGAAAARLAGARVEIVRALESGFPCLGICLGMQLMFHRSEESPGEGLGFLGGQVRRLKARRMPQMGWNDVEVVGAPDRSDPLFDGIIDPVVYYANTYVPEPDDEETVIAWTTYDNDRFPAAIRKRRVWGVQFHPEKSADAGLSMIEGFIREALR